MTEAVERMLPLYESKMIHQFDHRWATYVDDDQIRDVTIAEKEDPDLVAIARYWVRESVVEDALRDRWSHPWQLAWRGIARTTDVRTSIASSLPRLPGGGNFDGIIGEMDAGAAIVLLGVLNSFAFDYITRQKLTNMHLQFSVMKQLPVPRPGVFAAPTPWNVQVDVSGWLQPRLRELSFTAWDVKPLAEELGDFGSPFRWDETRRAQLRAELDAAFFHLYGVVRDDVDYILDTFPIVRRKDEAEFGEYRTKRLVLTEYDAMAEAAATGEPYRSPVDPSPGHGPRHPARTP